MATGKTTRTANADIQMQGAAPASAVPGKRTLTQDLLDRSGGTAPGLRAVLTANPGVAPPLGGLVADPEGGDLLNRILGQAFPAQAVAATAPDAGSTSASAEKNPTDPTVALPPAKGDTKKLAKGDMTWSLTAVNHSQATCKVDFKPDTAKVDAKNISFVQTVLNQFGTKRAYAGTTPTDPVGNKADYEKFEESTEKRRVDHYAAAENDPFYGAEWDQSTKAWKKEAPASWQLYTKGKTTSAKMDDSPFTPPVRSGFGDYSISFETVPTVLETREPLGALKWGWKCEDKENAPIVLTGGDKADCVDTPSTTWSAALDKFFEAKFDVIIDGFDPGKADLKATHKSALDGIVNKWKTDTTLNIQLGGGADLKEADPAGVSQKRAEAAKNYLVVAGVTAGKITIETYGADWARVETSTGKDEPKNRRVQVWVKK